MRELIRTTLEAATEQAVSLPLATSRVQIFVRTNASVRYSFVAGESSNGTRVSQTRSHDTGDRGWVGEKIYLTGPPGAIVEVYAWHFDQVIADSFSDGFTDQFA